LPAEFLTVAVAGTPTSLSCIKQNLKIYDEKKVEHSKLDLEYLNNIIDDFSKKSPRQILSDYGSVLDGREDIILAGTIILAEICKSLQINDVLVSSKGIRHGVVVNYIKNEFQNGK
jgi:exopolyphosphatase/guanosine-5'-triphosphate,3'-diphosphate pyrophosphatase